MNFAEHFKKEYYDKMLTPNGQNPVRDRASGMLKVFEMLDSWEKESYYIVETGTLRPDHGDFCYGDDGASTVIFDDFISKKGGRFVSIDINKENIEYAKQHCKNTQFYCMDSVYCLENKLAIIPENERSLKIDLLYLDSFDITKDNPMPSAIHHVFELLAAKDKMRIHRIRDNDKNTIVCVDDADAFFDGGKTGKAMLIKKYIKEHVGDCDVIHDGYQFIFQI